MKIILSNSIEITNPTDEVLNYAIKTLSFINPGFSRLKILGYSTYNVPKEIKLYNFYQDKLYLPIGCFDDIWKIHPVKEDYIDYTVTKKANIKSNIILRDYQEPTVRAFKEHCTGILSLKVGCGKTESILHTIACLGQKTLFMAHTIDLVNQAKDRCEAKMECKTSMIANGKMDLSGDIVFGTVQSVLKFIENGDIKQDEFGMVVMDECFPAGTRINTPSGYKNIEDIKIGDDVYSYNHEKNKIEIKKVNYLFNKDINEMINIKLSNGTMITCTRNHPIYVNGEYKRADEIKNGDVLYEMQLLWERDREKRFFHKTMGIENKLLQKNGAYLLFSRAWKKICKTKSNILYKKRNWSDQYECEQPNVQRRSEEKSKGQIIGKKLETCCTWGKWERFNYTAKNTIRRIISNGRINTRVCCSNKNKKRKWLSDKLQDRYCDTIKNDSNRSGWLFSLFHRKTKTRYEKRGIIKEVRVESVEVQKQRNIRKQGKDNRGIKVYNIGVLDNNNYFVSNMLVHNCQHVSADIKGIQMFRTVFEYFAARYKAGLSAEVIRSDGLEKCIFKIVGNVIYGMTRDGNDYVCIYEGKEIMRFGADKFQVPCHVIVKETGYDVDDENIYDHNGGKLIYARLINAVTSNKKRNDLILEDLKKINGSTIILSDRIEQLKYFEKNLDGAVEIDGSTPKRDREARLEEMRNGTKKYLLASYSLAKEGLDITRLSNLVLASPVKFAGTVIQSCGRIQRPFEGKTIAYVYDYVDNVGMLYRYYTKRRKIYKDNNWKIDNKYLSGVKRNK